MDRGGALESDFILKHTETIQAYEDEISALKSGKNLERGMDPGGALESDTRFLLLQAELGEKDQMIFGLQKSLESNKKLIRRGDESLLDLLNSLSFNCENFGDSQQKNGLAWEDGLVNKVKNLKLVLEDKEKLVLDFRGLLEQEKSEKNANAEDLKNVKNDLKIVMRDHEATLAAFNRETVFLQESNVKCEGQARIIEQLEKTSQSLVDVQAGNIS